MPLINKSQQTLNAQVLRDETVEEANTALRVYGLYKDLIDSALFYDQVAQIGGSGTTTVMSQKAVTDALTALIGGAPNPGNTLGKLYNLITDIGQLVGGWNSSSLPTTGTGPSGEINKGDYWKITGTITIVGVGDLKTGDTLIASVAGASVAADFFALQSNVDQATASIAGLVKLYVNLSASNTDGTVTQAAIVAGLALKQDKASKAPTDITASISGGAVTIACSSNAETEVYLATNSNLNIAWTNLNEGGIIYLRIERTTTGSINVNFNDGINTDCYIFGNSQIIGNGSPLLLAGYVTGSGRNRIQYLMSIECYRDKTVNRLQYAIRYEDSGSIVVV